MSEEKSPLDMLMQRPDFKPFSGRHAFRVLELSKSRLNMPPVSVEDVLKAVSSLGVVLETEVAMIFAMQEVLCRRCGDCCRERGSIRLRKDELQGVANYLHVEYKRLKEQLKAVPVGDGTFVVSQPCRFLKDNLCVVYSARPGTCRSYPTKDLLANMGQGKSFDGCPIADTLLSEIVVKRVLEEQMWRDNPEELKMKAEKRRMELARLRNLSQGERMRLLTEGYAKTIRGTRS